MQNITLKKIVLKKGDHDTDAGEFLERSIMKIEHAKNICSTPITECKTEETQKIWVAALFMILRVFILKRFPGLKARELKNIEILIEEGADLIKGKVKRRRDKSFDFEMPFSLHEFRVMNEKDLNKNA